MSEEGAKVVYGEYLWHPLMPSLTSLLEDMRGSMERKSSRIETSSEKSARIRKAESIAPKISELKTQGLGHGEIAVALGIAYSTLTKYKKIIREQQTC